MPLSICAIIPTLNEEECIVQCIEKLRARGVAQIIVADGGSHDRTVQLATDLGTKVVRAIRGRGQQLHAATCHVEHPIIWLVHADCTPPSTATTTIAESVESGAQWGAFAIEHIVPHDASRLLRWCLTVANKRSRTTVTPYGDQAIFVTRELLQQIGGVPQQEIMEDLELSIRLNKITPPVIHQSTVSVDSRRFVRHPVKTFLAWMTFPWLYKLRVSPQRLMRWYSR